MSRIEKRFPPIGEFVTIDGIHLHYQRAGEGPALALIHGASGNLRDWNFGSFDAMARSNDTIAFDRPGFGYSERPLGAEDPAVQAALLKAASENLGQKRPIILGHSYGGVVALSWALLEPDDVAGLMLLAAPSHEWEEALHRRYSVGSHKVFGPILRALTPIITPRSKVESIVEGIFTPQAAPETYMDNMGAELAIRPHTLKANTADVSNVKTYLARMFEEYDRLTMPVEILHGDADVVVNIELQSDRLAKRLPHANYTRLNGMGHMPQHFAQSDILEMLDRLNASVNKGI